MVSVGMKALLILGMLTFTRGHDVSKGHTYNVQFNNNAGGGGSCRGGDDDACDNERETYIIGHESYTEERKPGKSHLDGFTYDIVTAAGHAGGCDIELVHKAQDRCLSDTDAPNALAFEIGESIMEGELDGCSEFHTFNELNWVAAMSDPYLAPVHMRIQMLTGFTFGPDSKIAILEEDEGGIELVLRVKETFKLNNDPIIIEGELEDVDDKIAKDTTINGIFASKRFFDSFATNIKLVASDALTLDTPGYGLLASKRQGDGLVACFNKGLERIMKHGKYDEICERHEKFLTDYGYECINTDDDDDDDDKKDPPAP
jgi:hypothetical protein